MELKAVKESLVAEMEPTEEVRAVPEDSGPAAADPDSAAGDSPSGADASDPESELGPGAELSDEELQLSCSALLFSSPEPLSLARLVKLLDGPEPTRVTAALERLERRLHETPLGLRLVPISGGWRVLTDEGVGDIVARLQKTQRPEKITAAGLETLAIVAYRQPVTKAEVEAIRGVQSGPILRALVDRGLLRVTGRADQPGAPLQYGTTKEFLDRFALQSIADLPRDGELAST
jgi:segregation and condensation protein B